MNDIICFNKRKNCEEIFPRNSDKILAKCRIAIGEVACRTGDKFYYVKRDGVRSGHWIGGIEK